MNIESFRFWVELPENFHMPRFAGSMLRGGFGHALRRLSCMTKQDNCRECALRKSCPYTQVFEVQAQQDQAHQILPSPYIIQPGRTIVEAQNKDYYFDFTLVGSQAIQQFPITLFAWQQAFRRGVGKDRTPLLLSKIEHLESNKTIFTEQEPILKPFHSSDIPVVEKAEGEIVVQFLSPLRLQQKKRLVGRNEFNLSVLFNAIVRRNRAVSEHLLGEALEYTDLSNLNNDVPLFSKLRWQDWSRYSSRQHQKMDLGGLIGSIRFNSSFLTDSQWQHLMMAQRINIGKHTVFGMGKIEVNSIT